jgi:hypothetical protein
VLEFARAAHAAAARRAARAASSRARRRAPAPAAARAGGAVAVIPLTGVITPRGSFCRAVRRRRRPAGLPRDLPRGRATTPTSARSSSTSTRPAASSTSSPRPPPRSAPRAARSRSSPSRTRWPRRGVLARRAGRRGRRHPVRRRRLDRRLHVHEDWSGFNEQMGIPTYISAGKYKTEGNPDEPLSDDAARAAMAADVDDFYGRDVRRPPSPPAAASASHATDRPPATATARAAPARCPSWASSSWLPSRWPRPADPARHHPPRGAEGAPARGRARQAHQPVRPGRPRPDRRVRPPHGGGRRGAAEGQAQAHRGRALRRARRPRGRGQGTRRRP